MSRHRIRLIVAALIVILLIWLLLRQCGPGQGGSSSSPADSTRTDSTQQGTGSTDSSGTYDVPADGKTGGKPDGKTPDTRVEVRAVPMVGRTPVTALFKGCKNKFTFDFVPLAGNTVSLRDIKTGTQITAVGASVLPGAAPGQWVVVPDGDKVTLRGMYKGTPVFDRVLPVINPPNPTVVLEADDVVVEDDEEITPGSKLVFRITPDAAFALLSPEDARYKIARVMVRPKQRISAPEEFIPDASNMGQPTVRLRLKKDFLAGISNGEKIWVQLDELRRINYLGKENIEPIDKSRLSYNLMMRK